MAKARKPTVGNWQNRIHGFLKPAEDKPEHFAAIGRLITATTGVETVLIWTLRALVGDDRRVSRSIVSNFRTGGVMEAIKRVATAKGASATRTRKIKKLMDDIEAFRSIRNHTAHRVWSVNEDWMGFSAYHSSKSETDFETQFYTIAELNRVARYAPYLSQRLFDLFPQTVNRSPGDRLPRSRKPRSLTKEGQRLAKLLPGYHR